MAKLKGRTGNYAHTERLLDRLGPEASISRLHGGSFEVSVTVDVNGGTTSFFSGEGETIVAALQAVRKYINQPITFHCHKCRHPHQLGRGIKLVAQKKKRKRKAR